MISRFLAIIRDHLVCHAALRRTRDSRRSPAQPNLSLSVGQISGTARHGLPERQRTRRMVALTRDLHVFASGVTTRISAVLFSIWYVAKTWYVRTFSCLLIRHYNCVSSSSTHLFRSLDRYDSLTQLFVLCQARMNRGHSRVVLSSVATSLDRLHADLQTSRLSLASLPEVVLVCDAKNNELSVDGLIAASAFGRLNAALTYQDSMEPPSEVGLGAFK